MTTPTMMTETQMVHTMIGDSSMTKDVITIITSMDLIDVCA